LLNELPDLPLRVEPANGAIFVPLLAGLFAKQVVLPTAQPIRIAKIQCRHLEILARVWRDDENVSDVAFVYSNIDFQGCAVSPSEILKFG
jgi:hypothetical protein